MNREERQAREGQRKGRKGLYTHIMGNVIGMLGLVGLMLR